MGSRIEVTFKDPAQDAQGRSIKHTILQDLDINVENARVVNTYSLEKDLSQEQVETCRNGLFTDPITQFSTVDELIDLEFSWAIEIGFLPGVTDNEGTTSREGIEDLLKVDFAEGEAVYTSKRILLKGDLAREQVERISGWLANDLIQRVACKNFEEFKNDGGMGFALPKVVLPASDRVDTVNLNVSDEDLLVLSKKGILDHVDDEGREVRRGPLALEMDYIYAIRDYFNDVEKRDPTDAELEVLAQTWSEHCKHTIFAANIDDVKSIYKSFIRRATEDIRRELGDDDWCLSVFKDNSGVIAFTEDYNLCYKVETHNSPSALDPYGGAITGIVGVNRDPMGTGKGSRLVTNMYGFCFGNPYYDKPLPCRDKECTDPILHPKVIFEGVRLGVEHGGNKSGIPTPWGFINFDDRYMGKPLVFVGTVGLMHKEINGQPSHEKCARPGDMIIMAGGRVGKDGIHGATFSSEGLHEGSPATAVQIGDPITQKKMCDAQQEAMMLGLYSSITDNGAGGLSSSVGEMALESGGCLVHLDKIPIKYSGILPYEIWISESQERMNYAVPPENVDAFLKLMESRGVEAKVIGEFTQSGRCQVTLNGKSVIDLDLDFMHDGLPEKFLKSTWTIPQNIEPEFVTPADLTLDLSDMLGRLNICSREYVSRQYDHEVQGGSVIKPLIGRDLDIHTDASVTRPLLDSNVGFALSNGILPSYGDIDTYHMTSCGIDTAIRNVVAVGADPKRIALLDNFCWCSSNEPERLGQLMRSVKACYDYSTRYKAPFISGKDSMFNDFKGFDGEGNPVKISVPPTLLLSSIARVNDINKCMTLDAKIAGDLVYVLGLTRDELGASEYFAYKGERLEEKFVGNNVPQVRTDETIPLYDAMHEAIDKELLASCQSIGLGGLGVALAKCAMGGMLGMQLDLSDLPRVGEIEDWQLLFSESQGRFLVTINPELRDEFERHFSRFNLGLLGTVNDGQMLEIKGSGGIDRISAQLSEIKESYKKTLRW